VGVPSSFLLTQPLVFYLEYNVCFSLPLVLISARTLDLDLVLVFVPGLLDPDLELARSPSLSSPVSLVFVLFSFLAPGSQISTWISLLFTRSCSTSCALGPFFPLRFHGTPHLAPHPDSSYLLARCAILDPRRHIRYLGSPPKCLRTELYHYCCTVPICKACSTILLPNPAIWRGASSRF
jgi:hypothetical protein